MKVNSWVKKISRIRVPRKSAEEKMRCDFAERWINFPEEFFKDFISTLKQEDFITYPSYQAYQDLKERIAALVGLQQENVFLATGSGSCIKDIIQVTCKEGSEIVSSHPCFPMYYVFGETFGAKFVKVPYTDDGTFELSSYEDVLTANTRLVILTNPNSPFGDNRSVEEIRVLCELLHKRGIVFLIDEAYVDFGTESSVELIKEFDNVVISRTFSKAWGAAGARVGYLLGSREIIELVSNIQLTYPITGPSLKFVNHLLDHKPEIEEYIQQTVISRDLLCNLLEESGYDVVRSEANSIHFHETMGDNTQSIKSLEGSGVSFKCGGRLTGTKVMVPTDDRTSWIRLSVGPGIEKSPFITKMIEDYGVNK